MYLSAERPDDYSLRSGLIFRILMFAREPVADSTVDVIAELVVESGSMEYRKLRDEEHGASRAELDGRRRAPLDDERRSSQLKAIRYPVGNDAIYVIGRLPDHLIKAPATAA